MNTPNSKITSPIILSLTTLSILSASGASYAWDPRFETWQTSGSGITNATTVYGAGTPDEISLTATDTGSGAVRQSSFVGGITLIDGTIDATLGTLDSYSVTLTFSEPIDFILGFRNINIPEVPTGGGLSLGEWVEFGVAPSSVMTGGDHFYGTLAGSPTSSAPRLGTTGTDASTESTATWLAVTEVSFTYYDYGVESTGASNALQIFSGEITTIPEPGSSLLCLISSCILLAKRRR